MSNLQQLAQEVVSRYSTFVDPWEPNRENVRNHLRKPIEAVTLFLLKGGEEVSETDKYHPTANDGVQREAESAETEEEKKSGCGDWRDYLAQGASTTKKIPDLEDVDLEAFAALGRRTKARVEAFLNGISIAVPNGEESSSAPVSRVASVASSLAATSIAKRPYKSTPAAAKPSPQEALDISLSEGLSGFGVGTTEKIPSLSSLNAGRKEFLRTLSSNNPKPTQKFQQIAKDELMTRVELYIRSLHRVKAQGQECVVAAEPARAIKARARSIVVAFVDTVDTVQQQSPVLTRLLKYMTQELLAVEHLAPEIVNFIRKLVQNYVQSVSFASLAFLTSPETSADTRLTPMVISYLKFLQLNWENCVMDCEMERMLACSIDQELRHTLKTIEFASIGHLLTLCHEFRKHLNQIEISPEHRVGICSVKDDEALRQALRDLKREVISVNGNVLPPIKSRKQLVTLLTQTLNSRALAKGGSQTRRLARRQLKSESSDMSESETEISSADEKGRKQMPKRLGQSNEKDNKRSSMRRMRSFQLTTIDFLTKRLLIAASRTGTGGDAYFIVRDLFGGEDVEVVPSSHIFTHGRHVRPGSIEITVKLASVVIKCHGSFDVYPKSMVGEVEPLIQLHTTTTEVIALQEVRASDSSSEGAAVEDEYSSDDSDEKRPVMIVQERTTDRTGWRTLSIRPALYERVEEFSTPS